MNSYVILVIALFILLLFIIITYNSIIHLKKKVEQSSSTIEVYLKQRFDLIPNLVETVKEYAKYESETLENVTKMRKNYLDNTSNLDEGAKLNNECNKIVFLSEKYPELKANENFLNLQKSLSKMESQLQAARRIYNSDVTIYNTKIYSFPSNIVAKIFGFKEAKLFEIETIEKENIKVNL